MQYPPMPCGAIGRPGQIELAPREAQELRARYVRSNLRKGAGSMTYAARAAAKDPASQLGSEARKAILKERKSKHTLPVAVRRACRGVTGDAAVAGYRDESGRKLAGMYTPGMLRMVREPDGSLRRLRPGERQSWDDASINFCVTIPWEFGGDRCSERYGCRLGRFQLLAGIDDATDYMVGWGYVIRLRDSYRAQDVIATCAHAWSTYQPEQVMFEGGAWQAQRTIEFLRLAGVEMIDAKGRPHNKLIEGVWNRLWTPLSELSNGQIGRYRGEMDRENELLTRCQAGSLDPRRVFPGLETALTAIQRGITWCNEERIESKYSHYGSWIPAEMHAAGLAAVPRPALSADIQHLTLRERFERTVRRGMTVATALSPLGEERPYHFCSEKLVGFDGAPVWVSFDPFHHPVTAHVSLSARWKDHPAGMVIDPGCCCVDAAPYVLADEASGMWRVGFADGAAEAARIKRLASAVVRRELRAHDLTGALVKGVSQAVTPAGADATLRLGGSRQSVELAAEIERRAAAAEEVDLVALEKEAGILTA